MDTTFEIADGMAFIGQSLMDLEGDEGILDDFLDDDKCWVTIP
ncbi:hypothetical protein [Sphingobacterium sp. LRF_L2]